MRYTGLNYLPIVALAFLAGAASAIPTETDLATTYKELSQMPLDSRKAAFRQLDAEARNGVWLQHIKWYRSQNPGITSQQSDVLASIEGKIKTNSFDSDLRKEMGIVIEAFGEEKATEIVTVLGPTPQGFTPVDAIVLEDSWNPEGLSTTILSCTKGRDCNCTKNWGGTCHECGKKYNCYITDSGCGYMWVAPCLGRS